MFIPYLLFMTCIALFTSAHQIETGPNQVIKDAGAGTIKFTEGPQTKRVFQ